MINKIFNWTACSFFRTLGRFIFYGIVVLLLSLLFSSCDVKAESISVGGAYNSSAFSMAPYARFYNNTGSSLTALTTYSNPDYGHYYATYPGSFSGYGGVVCINLNETLVAGYIYSLMVLVGANSTSFYPTVNWYKLSIGSTLADAAVKFYDGVNYANLYSFTNTIGTFNVSTTVNDVNYSIDTGAFNIVFEPTVTDVVVCIPFGFNSTYNNMVIDFLGYNLTALGPSTDSLRAAISAENVATASDLEEATAAINENIDSMKEEQQQTNEELGEMNDYLQDDTPASTEDIDMDSLGTVSGLLPAGPVDSLLNIPFTFLSVLTSSMSGTCVPITGTFVFDSTLSIPCFDSFYDEVPDYLMNFINLIPAGFILILYFKHLYKKVDRAVSLQSTADDEWGVI